MSYSPMSPFRRLQRCWRSHFGAWSLPLTSMPIFLTVRLVAARCGGAAGDGAAARGATAGSVENARLCANG